MFEVNIGDVRRFHNDYKYKEVFVVIKFQTDYTGYTTVFVRYLKDKNLISTYSLEFIERSTKKV